MLIPHSRVRAAHYLRPVIRIALVLVLLTPGGIACHSTKPAGAAGSADSPTSSSSSASEAAKKSAKLPRPDHVVIVIEENKSYDDVIGFSGAPYINSLAAEGASLTAFYALHHPSQPNYVELFSGNAQSVFNDNCMNEKFSGASLGGSLLKERLSFAGYAEDLPSDKQACIQGEYARKHCPWIDFKDVPDALSKPFTEFPTSDDGFASLPTVSFVIPNLVNDMHSMPDSNVYNVPGEVANGDTWLQKNLSAYAQWARSNNSLLIVTWDEDSDTTYVYPNSPDQKVNTVPPKNRIPTLLVGQMVSSGSSSSQQYTFYDLLRTLEDMYGLPLLGGSEHGSDITGIWTR